MGLEPFSFFLFLATLALVAATSRGTYLEIPHQIHLLRPKSGARTNDVPDLSCLSWRLAVETNNIIGWKTIPEKCEGYLGHYMLGQQYREDSEAVAYEAILYAQSLELVGDGKDIWIFDIDETSLSNLPYYAKHGFGYVTVQVQFNLLIKKVLRTRILHDLNKFSFDSILLTINCQLVFIRVKA